MRLSGGEAEGKAGRMAELEAARVGIKAAYSIVDLSRKDLEKKTKLTVYTMEAVRNTPDHLA